jgi:hypothetical protein
MTGTKLDINIEPVAVSFERAFVIITRDSQGVRRTCNQSQSWFGGACFIVNPIGILFSHTSQT